MPTSRRSNRRPYSQGHIPFDEKRARGGVSFERDRDGDWTVRTVRSADKTYICPACQQQVPAGVEHVVAWNRDAIGGEAAGLEFRRHWHSSCWRRRANLR